MGLILPLYYLTKDGHGDTMSVTNWIRLSTIRDVRSQRASVLLCAWRSSSPTRAAGSHAAPRNPRGSCPFRTGRKSNYAGIPPASRGPLGYPPVEALLFGLLHAYTRLNGARLPVHRYPDALPILGNPKTSTAWVGRSYESS